MQLPYADSYKRMKHLAKSEIKTDIHGILVPSEWENQGKVAGLSFYTHCEDEYKIDPQSPFFKELLNLLHQSITISGKVITGKKGERILQVTEYNLI